MIGYKGFDKNLKCRDFQFEVGKTFKQDGEVKLCENGFHFCELPLDTFSYYSPATSRYCVVEGGGEMDDGNRKTACSVLNVKKEINLFELANIHANEIKARVDLNNKNKLINTSYRSAAINRFYYKKVACNYGTYSLAKNYAVRGAAIATGDYSVAENCTDKVGVAVNVGNHGVSKNFGIYGAALNTGYSGVAMSAGMQSIAASTGDNSAVLCNNVGSVAVSTGGRCIAQNTGSEGVALATGDSSAASVEGNGEGAGGIAIALGFNARAKGAKGDWLVLAEWRGKLIQTRVSVQCFYVDGEKVKENIYYVLKDGKLVEWEDKND